MYFSWFVWHYWYSFIRDFLCDQKLEKNVTSASFYKLFSEWRIRILIGSAVLQSPTDPAHLRLDSEHKKDMLPGRVYRHSYLASQLASL